ncbi:MAG: energy-coupling factor transporter transmembrane component T family protein, partial [Promethearchaeota archaeon]
LITIFIPFYVGNTIVLQFNIGIMINVYREGFNLALLLFFRIIGALFIFMSFFSYLTYSEFIEALTKLRIIPSLFIGSLVIMLHYIPILADSNKKILEAQELRGKKMTTYREKFKTHAYIMGKSIARNLERSEKLYESLRMRGFSGKITFATKKIRFIDVTILVLFLAMMIYFIFIIDLKSIYQGVFDLFLS